MTTTENNTPAVTDWDALFNAATVEPIKKPVERPKFEGEVPDGLKRLVDQALKTGERIVLPCDNPEAYDQVIAMAVAHVERVATGKVVYGTARYADAEKKKLTHVTFTVGERRGRKRSKSDATETPAETAAAPETSTPATPETSTPAAPAADAKSTARKRGAQQ